MSDAPHTDATSADAATTRTDRLVLDRVRPSDVAAWHEIHADPRVWSHFPSGRHHSVEATESLVQRSIEDWTAGLGYWSVRTEAGGPIIGCGGCRLVPNGDSWNLYYRFSPDHQGHGYATELARAAVDAATTARPDTPVLAIMLEHNVASWRVAENIGLVRVWTGPDDGNPDPNAVRLVYTNRPDATL